MSRMKNELSSRNPYHISKHKMLELRHFCLQYPEWKKEYSRLSQISVNGVNLDKILTTKTNDYTDQTAQIAVEKAEYFTKMKLVERTANEADSTLGYYILKAVTEDISFDKLNARSRIPCCRDTFYDRYRKFFWLLSKER